MTAALCFSTIAAGATTTTPLKGLQITPVRQYLSAGAGSAKDSSFVVANLTAQPLTVNFIAQQFSVQDYSYNYTFARPSNDWLKLSETSLALAPQQSKTIPYTITIPAKAAPGGYYYTLLASATVQSGGVTETMQAADQLYVTVTGNLTTVSHLESSSIPRIIFGKTIPFTLNAINTGNVYSFVFVSGQLHGPLAGSGKTSSGRLLMPGHVRTLTGSIDSPTLPGIYRAQYGYKTDGGWIVQESRWILYIPPWSIAVLLGAALILGAFLRHRKQKISS